MKRLPLLLTVILVLYAMSGSVDAATQPPQGAVDVAQAWLTEAQTGPLPLSEAMGTRLGPAFRLYVGNTARIYYSKPNGKLLDAFSPRGWMFLVLDENGKGHAVLTVSEDRNAGGWRFSSFGKVGSQLVRDLDEMSRRLPEQASAKGVEKSRLELAVLHFEHTRLLVATDGRSEQVTPLGQVQGGPWRHGEAHSGREAVERLQEVIKARPKGYGGSGAVIQTARRWWPAGLGGGALIAAGFFIWRRRSGPAAM